MGLKSRFGFTDEDKQQGVSGLEDRPKCSASELKSAFDWLCTQVIMPRINDLLDFLDSDSLMGSTVVYYDGEKVELQEAVTRLVNRLKTLKSSGGAANIGALNGETSTTVQDLLDFILDEIRNVELGVFEIPAGGITSGKLADGCVKTSKLADDCKAPFAGTADRLKGYGTMVRSRLIIRKYSHKDGGLYFSAQGYSGNPSWENDPKFNLFTGDAGNETPFIATPGTYRIKAVVGALPPDVLTGANDQVAMQSCSIVHKRKDSGRITISEDCKQVHYQHGCLFVLEKNDVVLNEGDKVLVSFFRHIKDIEGADELSTGYGYIEFERLGD